MSGYLPLEDPGVEQYEREQYEDQQQRKKPAYEAEQARKASEQSWRDEVQVRRDTLLIEIAMTLTILCQDQQQLSALGRAINNWTQTTIQAEKVGAYP